MSSARKRKAPLPCPLAEAAALVDGDRHDDYGEAEENFNCIAELVTVYLKYKGKLKEGERIDRFDWAMIMSLNKHGRETGQHKRDNLVDSPGYLKILNGFHKGK